MKKHNKAEKIILLTEDQIVLIADHKECDEDISIWEYSYANFDSGGGTVVEIENTQYTDVGDKVVVAGNIINKKSWAV